MKKLEGYQKIDLSDFMITVIDPIISTCCCCLKKACGSHQRNKILEKTEEKINSELEITSLLHKLRNSYDSIKQYQSKSKMMVLKLNKERVIDI